MRSNGSDARSEAEKTVLSPATELDEIGAAIERLERRDNETFQRYLEHIQRRRYAPPLFERLFDLDLEDEIMLKLVHTADWHLGRTFRSFSEEGALKLSRARIEVLDRILHAADRHAADALLCAGDLFDDPHPGREWWEEVAARLQKAGNRRPIFLLPGNHDPCPRSASPHYGI